MTCVLHFSASVLELYSQALNAITLFVIGQYYGGVNLCEFIIFFLTSMYNVLMLVTISEILLCKDKYGMRNRYMVLLRYNSRLEYYTISICARIVYAIGCVAILLVLLILCGKYRGLSEQEPVMFVQVSACTVVKQCMSIIGYTLLIIALCSLFDVVLRNKVPDVLLTMGVPRMNLMLVKTGIYRLAGWMPWHKIALQLYGWDNRSCRFNWEYWVILTAISLYIGDRIFVNKDIVYENH